MSFSYFPVHRLADKPRMQNTLAPAGRVVLGIEEARRVDVAAHHRRRGVDAVAAVPTVAVHARCCKGDERKQRPTFRSPARVQRC